MLNLPLITSLVIIVGFSADLPLLEPLKTEATFGLWVVVLAPLAVLLLVTQVALWIRVPSARPLRQRRTQSGP